MNILVLSDTHGELNKSIEMYNRLNGACKFDMVLHCGDFGKDAIALQKEFDCEVVYVQGNCDGCEREDIQVVETPAGKIMITHGHMENVNYGHMNLIYKAQELGCVCACYGHTHVPVNEVANGIHIVNPGSLTRPLGGSVPSCAIVVATEKGISASIMQY